MFTDLIYDISTNRAEYINIYKIYPKSNSWKTRSISNFLIDHYLHLLMWAIVLVLNVIGIFRKTTLYKRIGVGSVVLIIIWISYHLFLYFNDGYHH